MPIKGLPGGSFGGCVSAMQGKVDDPEAFCADKTHELTGKWPGQESHGGSAMVAFRIPEAVAEQLLASVTEAGCAKTAKEDLHLTMAYLGNVEDLPTVEVLLETLASLGIDTIECEYNGYAVFPQRESSPSRPVVALVGSKALAPLHFGLDTLLENVGVKSPDDTFFIPHITVARVFGKEDIPAPRFEDALTLGPLYLVHEESWHTIGRKEKTVQEGGTIEINFGEAIEGNLSLREAPNGDVPFVLMDGRMIVEGLSKRGNFYTLDSLPSFIEQWAGKPIRLNHPASNEQKTRPEGDVTTQVGMLPGKDDFSIEEVAEGAFAGRQAVFFKNARMSISPPDLWIRDRIKSGIIGDLSINGGGEGIREADGTFRVTKAVKGVSLDLVTAASAGGKSSLQESDKEVDSMTPEEIRKVVLEAVQEYTDEAEKNKDKGKSEGIDAVMEAYGLGPEIRPLVEAALVGLQSTDDEGPTEEANVLDVLDEENKVAWTKAFEGCMSESGDEMLCSNAAWASVVAAMTASPEEKPPVEEGEEEEEEKKEKKEEQEANDDTAVEEAIREAVKQLFGSSLKMGGVAPSSTDTHKHTQPANTGKGKGITMEEMEKRIQESAEGANEGSGVLFSKRLD